MIKNKMQRAINFIATSTAFICIIGLTGSYELDNISTLQFFMHFVTALIIIYTIYKITTLLNVIITKKLYPRGQVENIKIIA